MYMYTIFPETYIGNTAINKNFFIGNKLLLVRYSKKLIITILISVTYGVNGVNTQY